MENDRSLRFDVSPFAPTQAEEIELRDYFELTTEIIAEVSPTLPAPKYDAYIAELRNPLTARGPRESWVARHDGRIVGAVEITYLDHENIRYAQVFVRVTRSLRRKGIGSTMLSACLDRVRNMGRDTLAGYNVLDDTPGLGWARGLGFVVVRRDAWQTLHIEGVDPALWQVSVPATFRLERWVDAAPDTLVDSFARARTAMMDAPMGASGVRQPAWTVMRVREREAELRVGDREHRFIVAVHEPTGEVAGLTEIAFGPRLPHTCFQQDTAVLSEYRGLGLGQAMKSAMMQWLTADHPEITEVRTTTAADNTHMIRVNAQLGYVMTAILNIVEAPVDALEHKLESLAKTRTSLR